MVITSATKYLNGHSDVIAGAMAGTRSLIEEVSGCCASGVRPSTPTRPGCWSGA